MINFIQNLIQEKNMKKIISIFIIASIIFASNSNAQIHIGINISGGFPLNEHDSSSKAGATEYIILLCAPAETTGKAKPDACQSLKGEGEGSGMGVGEGTVA